MWYILNRMNKLIDTIDRYQEEHQLSDRQFADLIGFDPSTLSKLKSGSRNPGARFLKALAHVGIYDSELSPNASEKLQKRFLAVFYHRVKGIVLRVKPFIGKQATK